MSLLRPPLNHPENPDTQNLPDVDESPRLSNLKSEFEPDSSPYLTLPSPPLRIPNLGHALLFVAFTGSILLLTELLLLLLGKSPASLQGGVITIAHPRLQLASQAATYLSVLVAAWFFYPVLWHRTFLEGIRWDWPTARRHAPRLIALGFVLGMMVQAVTYFITPPKTLPIDDFFLTATDAWLITFFGTIVAPIFEEICFRGFLVPAFAIAYDWLSLPRTPEAVLLWRSTTTLSTTSFVFSGFVTSVFFAWLHAAQLGHTWAAVAVLLCVSFLFTWVRWRTQSVACSALLHATYNFAVFVSAFIASGGYRHLDKLTR